MPHCVEGCRCTTWLQDPKDDDVTFLRATLRGRSDFVTQRPDGCYVTTRATYVRSPQSVFTMAAEKLAAWDRSRDAGWPVSGLSPHPGLTTRSHESRNIPNYPREFVPSEYVFATPTPPLSRLTCPVCPGPILLYTSTPEAAPFNISLKAGKRTINPAFGSMCDGTKLKGKVSRVKQKCSAKNLTGHDCLWGTGNLYANYLVCVDQKAYANQYKK